MTYRLFAKSPTEMRREAEEQRNPKPKQKPKPRDPKVEKLLREKRPLLDGANFAAFLRRGTVQDG